MAAFVIDREMILERLGGDEELYVVMGEMFIADIDSNCATLTQALAVNDLPALQREVHTVKGLLATFSDLEGAAQAQVFEDQLRAGVKEGVGEAVAGMERRLREVAAVLAADLAP